MSRLAWELPCLVVNSSAAAGRARLERVLVPGEGGKLLPQNLKAGPLLGVPMPARQRQLVCGRRALRGAGHAVA